MEKLRYIVGEPAVQAFVLVTEERGEMGRVKTVTLQAKVLSITVGALVRIPVCISHPHLNVNNLVSSTWWQYCFVVEVNLI